MNRVFTIPNLLSMLRLVMIGVIIYFFVQDQITAMAVTLVISGITDVADGYIARHFNMITNLGKVLDPIADKMTQATAGILLSIRHPVMVPLIVILFLKEFIMTIFGALVLNKTHHSFSSRWWGKLSSSLFALSTVLICFLDQTISPLGMNLLVWIPAAALIFSLIMYGWIYYRILVKNEDIT